MDAQPWRLMQVPVSISPCRRWEAAGEGRNVAVSTLRSRPICDTGAAAACLTQITSSAAKEAKLPAAASIHMGPVLSAMEARKMPATSKAVFFPFIFTPACSLSISPSRSRLTSPSDNPRPSLAFPPWSWPTLFSDQESIHDGLCSSRGKVGLPVAQVARPCLGSKSSPARERYGLLAGSGGAT